MAETALPTRWAWGEVQLRCGIEENIWDWVRTLHEFVGVGVVLAHFLLWELCLWLDMSLGWYPHSISVSLSHQNDDVQDLDVRWDQALPSTNETLTDTVLEGLYKFKITWFCSVADCIGFVRSRNCADQWANKLFNILNNSEFVNWA